jgi:hypothetical protein
MRAILGYNTQNTGYFQISSYMSVGISAFVQVQGRIQLLHSPFPVNFIHFRSTLRAPGFRAPKGEMRQWLEGLS